ncbi:GntR family transcriptional regulator [Dietzia sp. UBA5065]|jgi:DNA-binding transcriptional regulator YhcF (GntR family)|uniref:GntR family transcriptional regulator n=1 Tax=Dietzia sp. UBA5065 TaxID=1946422 RepID=UPI0025C62495|nr:GntR family transcriptional regulator [Dietzia sp. UBA5065]HMT49572.1 GntR family transcriptional regulator [Dietzia sp.]
MSEPGATAAAPGEDPRAGGGSRPTGGGSRVAGVVLGVDPASADPPFRQLKGQILEAVRRGLLTPGTRMPAVRTLADQVGVAANTAAKVYRELEEAGVLEGRGRSGTFVAAADLPSAVLARAAEEFTDLATGAGFGVDDAVEAVRNAFVRQP